MHAIRRHSQQFVFFIADDRRSQRIRGNSVLKSRIVEHAAVVCGSPIITNARNGTPISYDDRGIKETSPTEAYEMTNILTARPKCQT